MSHSSSYPDPIELTVAERQYPLAPSTIDASHYTDPEQFEREIEHIFLNAWFPVCPSGDLAFPRDFMVWDHLRQSVVVVRQDDGTVAAWHNVCQHRGARLVGESGHCQTGRFNCPWHGFSYDLAGTVQGVPLRPSFDAAELDGLRAPPVRVTEWAGFVWLSFSDELPELKEYLGDIGVLMEGYGMEGFETKSRVAIKVSANWKVVVDAFNETWHVPFTHQHTLSGFIQWRDAVLRLTPPHSWMTIPVRGFTDRADENDPDVRKSHLCHYLVFPNTIFSCFPTHLQTWSAWPISPTETLLCAYGVFGPPPEGVTKEKWASRNDRDWKQFLEVLDEDVEVLNQTNSISQSLGWKRNMFNTAESRLQSFHEEVRARIGEPAARGPAG
jgi:phenylpropionate dioxygenase-like ring-hydroxylating dioxygenase large terminal subunit